MTQPPPWWQTAVIYQIYPRSFKDTNGDGIGDLNGITEKLEYLCDTLGVDAFWISPFYPSPMADFGYDVADFTDVDPIFGTLSDFDHLVAEAHQRGLKVLVDFVPNHSSDQHPWFIASRASRDNPKRDWYVWHDARPDGSPPNNWLSVFGGPAWTWDEATGQYYLHSFLKEQPDLNWRNPAVKAAMLNNMRFWLERGVDGFRIDVAHYMMKDPHLRDNPPNPEADPNDTSPLAEYGTLQHIHDKGHADIHPLYREIRTLLDAYSDPHPRFAIGEIHLYEWNAWAAYYGKNLDELHMPFNFALMMAPWSASHLRAVVDGLEAALPPGAWPNYVLGNHDEPRLASRYGPEQARLAALLLLTLRGTPTLYYGDELGMQQRHIPPDKQQDPYGWRVPGRGRDGCRTPMQWDTSPHAGFTTATAPWLPVEDASPIRNMAHQQKDPASLLTFYQKLLALRKKTRALQMGAYHPIDPVPEDCYVYTRSFEAETIMVALNFSANDQAFPLPASEAMLLLSTNDNRRPMDTLHTPLVLAPYEGLILQL